MRILLITLAIFLLSTTQPLLAEERHIHLNGVHLDDESILRMDAVFSQRVPDGYYWINDQTGEWGYEGDPEVQGVLTADNQPEQSHTRSSGGRSDYNDTSSTGSVVSGQIDGRDCTFASAGGYTFKSCD